jgi:hypothetical protein
MRSSTVLWPDDSRTRLRVQHAAKFTSLLDDRWKLFVVTPEWCLASAVMGARLDESAYPVPEATELTPTEKDVQVLVASMPALFDGVVACLYGLQGTWVVAGQLLCSLLSSAYTLL